MINKIRWKLIYRRILSQIFLTMVSTLLSLYGAERFYSSLPPKSDSFNASRMSRRWFARYWHPINSLGYRDVEHSFQSLHNKRVLYVVGDSFTAGHGINHVEDRFSNILQKKIGPDWEVVNISQCGWNTWNELPAMRKYPASPSAIVLAYYLNDIKEPRWNDYHKRRYIPRLIKYLMKNSYLADSLYWRAFRYVFAKSLSQQYWSFYQRSYADQKILVRHENELAEFVEFAKQHKAPLLVVIIPDLANISTSMAFTNKIVDFFRGKGVDVLDLGIYLKERPLSNLIVNSMDWHASVELHKEIAFRILPFIKNIAFKKKVASSVSSNR